MKKNLRSIIFAGAISTVGALGIAGVVAVPVASAAVISHNTGSASDTTTAVTPSQNATPAPQPPVTEQSTGTSTTSTVDQGWDILLLHPW
jgi:hypothetical protein